MTLNDPVSNKSRHNQDKHSDKVSRRSVKKMQLSEFLTSCDPVSNDLEIIKLNIQSNFYQD